MAFVLFPRVCDVGCQSFGGSALGKVGSEAGGRTGLHTRPFSVDHARQLSKSLIRKPIADRLLKERDADIQNFVQFISRDSIQKSLHAYLEKLKQKKA